MSNLRNILAAVKGEKIRERTEAIQSLRRTFNDDRTVRNFSKTESGAVDPRNWLVVFQAMFKAIATEKDAVVKALAKAKSTTTVSAASRRLEDAAKTIRHLIERSTESLNKKVLKSLFDHLLLTLVDKNQLYTPIAFDYLKAIKHLASYRPHLDHMDDDVWIRLVEICFNVILGDPLRTSLSEAAVSESESEAESVVRNVEDVLPTIEEGTLKRRRTDRDSAPPRQAKHNFTRRGRQISVTSEQVECVALLSILLSSPTNPICLSGYPYLPAAILSRLERFLDMYPSESSLLHDYLSSVVHTLNCLALNKVRDTRSFARATWDGFVSFWGLKDKRMKEQLAIIIRVLFPYILVDEPVFSQASGDVNFNIVDSLSKLWSALDSEAEIRWGANGLSLNALRLVIGSGSVQDNGNPFIANTFSSDWNFDPDQALTWAILELQADCARELFKLSESMPPATPNRRGEKRSKLQNPITTLLQSIQTQIMTNVRSYHLQVLLFFVDRHWLVVHDTLKREIVTTLMQLVSLDDFDVQSWIFLNFAAIAFAEKHWAAANPDTLASSQAPEIIDAATWDPIWTHVVRRATVPQVCRAACHAAHSLLISLYRFTPPSGHVFLSSSKVLAEIEAFGKDLDVQGPHAPYDSVCMFLIRCLKIAAQDVRLYRMRMEDKVLNWLMDTWVITGADKGSVTSHSTNDLLLLLETISGLNKHSDLVIRSSIPSSPIAGSMKMERRLKTIRNFLLFAKLPSYALPKESSPTDRRTIEPDSAPDPTPPANGAQVPGRGRERRTSGFLQRMLEALSLEWNSRTSDGQHPTIEVARRTLDFAVITIAYEATLSVNSIAPNRRIMQVAGKLLKSVFSMSRSSRWTLSERVVLVAGLEPIVWTSQTSDDSSWEAITLPDFSHDGVNRGEREVISTFSDPTGHLRGTILRTIWKTHELFSSLEEMSNYIRSDVEQTSGSTGDPSVQPMEIDDKDGFGPVKTNISQTPSAQSDEKCHLLSRLFEIHFLLLIRGPLLNSLSGEPTRDRTLVDQIIQSAASNSTWFVMILPILLREIEIGALEFNSKQLMDLLEAVGSHLQAYNHSRNREMQLLVVNVISSTIKLWTTSGQDVQQRVSKLREWLTTNLAKENFNAWETRDAFVQFLDKYLSADPLQESWKTTSEQDLSASETLQLLAQDDDIRVRFRIAITLPRLFGTTQGDGDALFDLYSEVRDSFSSDVDNYEQMATRFLSLANIMIVSSAVRRGPYWHLLETCHHTSVYSMHIESVLNAVVERLGMPSLKSLFSAYAFQLAHSMIKKNADFLAFPPRLLGYRDRSTCADAAFRVFVPTYIILDATPQYENYCRVLHKDPADGLKECFGDIVGFYSVTYFDTNPEGSEQQLLTDLCGMLQRDEIIQSDFDKHVDTIVAAILRTLGDQDYGSNGPIFTALQSCEQGNNKVPQVFHLLTRYRHLQSFAPHRPNLPAFGASTILKGLSWIFSRVPGALNKATVYHVMHELFANIQETPLINEKFRLLNALCLWIAFRNEEFNDATLLHAVLHGASSLLGQASLARAAQSVLEWTFRSYRKLKTADSRLSRVLIRIGAICHDYATQTRDPALAKLGADLLAWTDEQTLALSKVTVLLPMIAKALPAWPHQPSDDLVVIQKSVTLDNLSAILEDEHIASNKFRVVRRLGDSQFKDELDFSRREFWRLKESLPPRERLQEEDIAAFTDLLVGQHGQIDSLNAEQPTINTIRHRHIRLSRKRDGPGEEMMHEARDSIIYGLMGLLEHESPLLVHNAYTTLRLMMAVLPSNVSKTTTWSPEYRTEVEFLQHYPRHAIVRPTRKLSILLTSDFYIEMSSKFAQWVNHITVLISDILSPIDSAFAQLYSILSSDVSTAEEMFPVLIFTILHAQALSLAKGDADDTSAKAVLSQYFTRILEYPNACLPCLKSIVDVVLHLRNFFPVKKAVDALSYNKWLDVDFYLLAQSAVKCGAYTTALLFLDLAPDIEPGSALKPQVAEQIQYEIYAHIDEPDGFYGIQTDNLHRFLVERFRHEEQWEKAFRFHGATLEAGSEHVDSETVEGLVQSFHSFGFNHLAIDTLQSSESKTARNKSSSSTLSYRLGWRSETWDLPDNDTYTIGAPLYHVLRCVHRERDLTAVDGYVHSALYREMDHLRSLGTESVTQIREVLQALMCLNQIVQWKSGDLQQTLQSRAIEPEKWKEFVTISNKFRFFDLENIMSVRISLVRSNRQREERQQIGNMVSPFLKDLLEVEKQCLLSLSKAARESGQIQIALNSILRAQKLETTASFDVSQEYANVLWSLKEEKVAVSFLNDLLKRSVSSSVPPTSTATLYARLGTWISEACLEKPTDTWEKYFKPAITELADCTSKEEDVVAVYHQCAVFADRQYHTIAKSADPIQWRVYVERKKQEFRDREVELQELQARNDVARYSDVKKAQADAQKLLNTDEALYKAHISARNEFLQQALKMYSRCLQVTDRYDNEASIKFSSLWFANFNDDISVGGSVHKALAEIPSRKFVFLAHQLSARITNSPSAQNSGNQKDLRQLLIRLCQEHPFHSVYQVYCLQADTVQIPPASTGFRQSGRTSMSQITQTLPSESQNERCAAAEDVLGQLREDNAIGPKIRDIEMLCVAYLEWAKFAIAKDKKYAKKKGPLTIPAGMRLLAIKNVNVPVLTADTKIDLTMKYADCAWIEKYSNTFETAGGVNLPKITICYGTDGVKYKQLFKGEGKDDMRQDAVMEQVFELVNKVLDQDRETSRRALRIRSYKVIPLGTQAGVLEFVGNTSPLRDWLTRNHPVYRPTDMKTTEAAGHLSKAHQAKDSPEQRIKVYRYVRQRYQPVFRHFFTEKHRNPMAWFSTRLRYTRSVATSSIVGHILGLGDRHTSNILMDNITGEVIHIDLGIAFDQGKLLPIPELVPFRLTRDIVDGMGVAGTQGVFQRCAEETLRVLRDGSGIIMTVLEVFKHDPLHSWTASEIKIKRVQDDAPAANQKRFDKGVGVKSGAAESADRALRSVARKLDKSLSVESTVNELIAEATDVGNLGQIFCGWAPHM